MQHPLLTDIGIDAMSQGDAGHGCAALTALLHDLGLELRAVIIPCLIHK